LLQGGASLDVDERGRSYPEEGTDPEGQEGDSYDRRDNVDEPVGKEGGDPKKNDVIEQVTPVSVNLGRPLCCPLWEVVTDQASANEEREKVAEGGACCGAKADSKQRHRKFEEKSRHDGEEN